MRMLLFLMLLLLTGCNADESATDYLKKHEVCLHGYLFIVTNYGNVTQVFENINGVSLPMKCTKKDQN